MGHEPVGEVYGALSPVLSNFFIAASNSALTFPSDRPLRTAVAYRSALIRTAFASCVGVFLAALMLPPVYGDTVIVGTPTSGAPEHINVNSYGSPDGERKPLLALPDGVPPGLSVTNSPLAFACCTLQPPAPCCEYVCHVAVKMPLLSTPVNVSTFGFASGATISSVMLALADCPYSSAQVAV